MRKVLVTLIVPLLIAAGIAIYQLYNSTKKEAKVILMMGGPGSGKGTQSQLIASEFGFIHLSVGDVLR